MTTMSTTTITPTTTSSFILPTPAPTPGPKFYTVLQDFSVCICDTYKTRDGTLQQYQGKDCSQLVQEVEAQSVMTTELIRGLRGIRPELGTTSKEVGEQLNILLRLTDDCSRMIEEVEQEAALDLQEIAE